MWVRGLKLQSPVTGLNGTDVAPYVGAWIETRPPADFGAKQEVAPYVGAWIETGPRRLLPGP